MNIDLPSIPGLTEAEVRLITERLQADPRITEVRLFGSRAQGSHRPESDIDLAVWGLPSALAAEALRRELEELPLPHKFGVVAWDSLQSPALRQAIEDTGRRIFCRARPGF